jgi:hypothetical protein
MEPPRSNTKTIAKHLVLLSRSARYRPEKAACFDLDQLIFRRNMPSPLKYLFGGTLFSHKKHIKNMKIGWFSKNNKAFFPKHQNVGDNPALLAMSWQSFKLLR